MDQPVNTTIRGRSQEARAAAFLEAKGFEILERNFRWRGGEIDLIVLDGPTLVFVEVRSATKSSPWLRYTLNSRKKKHLLWTAQQYLLRNFWARHRASRFDAVWIEGDSIEHWKNIAVE